MQSYQEVEVPPKHIVCPITMEIMKDPVIVVNGDSYERTAIESWFKDNSTLPLSNEVITDKRLYPNTALKICINQWVTQYPQPISTIMDEFIPQIRQKPMIRSPGHISLDSVGFLSSARRVLSSSSVGGFGTSTMIEFSLSRQSSSRIIPIDPTNNSIISSGSPF